MLSLDALVDVYPGARFLWTHRDPAEVMGSVCSLIAYTRSWVSDQSDPDELGQSQLSLWEEALHRALDFRARIGDDRFGDVGFDDLQRDPVGAVERAYRAVGLSFPEETAGPMSRWAEDHPPGSQGTHEFALSDFGLRVDQVRDRFAFYRDAFGVCPRSPGRSGWPGARVSPGPPGLPDPSGRQPDG